MRILIYVFFISISAGLMSSCKNAPKEKTPLDLLYDEVMAVHDEVMPLMSDMHKNERALKKYINPKLDLTDAQRNSVRTNVTNLENTAEAMMEWMSSFSKPKDEDSASATKYLEAEKLKITKVSKAMKLSYERSSVLLNELPKLKDQ